MLTLDEWLRAAGFSKGNPFALKEADRAESFLQELFVQHPAFDRILDGSQATPVASSVLYAPRGAGKSTSRRMFEANCATHRPGTLVVRLTDWIAVAERRDDPRFASALPHLEQLFQQTVAALAQGGEAAAPQAPTDPAICAALRWMCAFAAPHLDETLTGALQARGWLDPKLPQADLRRLPARAQLEQLVRVVRSLGFADLYVLIDNIDELLITVNNPGVAAELLAPLLGNLRLNEVPNLGFKYFIPSTVFRILQQRNVLRGDRIGHVELRWDDERGAKLLRDLLKLRLKVYSDKFHESLGAVAGDGQLSIDDRLIAAARGNPRLLLNLGDWTIRACSAHASADDWWIRPGDLAAAEARAQEWIADAGVTDLGMPVLSFVSDPAEATEAPPAPVMTSPAGVPLFRLRDGELWRGDRIVEAWHSFTPLQRAFIEYLYNRRGKVCRKEDLLRDVWASKGFQPGDDTLRKLAERVAELIEPDPAQPVYLEKLRGGHYRLNNTAT